MALNGADMMRQALAAGRFDNVMNNAAFSTQQTNKAAAESGQAMGVTMHVMSDPLAELQDSMEELSFSFEEKAMKTLGERKLGEAKNSRSAMLLAIQSWQKIFPDMPGQAVDRIFRNLQNLMRGAGGATTADVLAQLKEASYDPSVQYGLLSALEEGLEGESGLKQLLGEAKRQLEQTKGPEIRAGINLAEQINAQAKTPEEMQDLRNLYRGEVLGFSTPQACFKSLLASRGVGQLEAAIDFLVKGCGIEMQSASPSRSSEELGRILGDLQCVQVLKAVLDKMGALAGKMSSQFGERCLLNAEQLAGRVLDFTEMPFVNAGNIAALLTSCGMMQLLAKIYFNTELINIFRGLSPRLFEQEEGRFRLEDAAQENLDGLVMQQDEEDRRKQKGSAA